MKISSILLTIAFMLALCPTGSSQTTNPQPASTTTKAKTTSAVTLPRDQAVLSIASVWGNCGGVQPVKCLQVKRSGEKDYKLFREKIEGFDYQEGYKYTVLVKVDTVKSPKKDSIQLKYNLVKVLSKIFVSNTKAGSTASSKDSTLSATNGPNTPLMNVAKDTTGLSGKLWQVQLFRIDTTTYDIKDQNISLLIHPEQKRITGKSTCNTYFAGLSYDKTLFKLGPVGSTKMFCENKMQTETLYFQALQACEYYEIKNGILYLKKGNKVIIELK